ncbi:hypothetical protein AA101099_1489 [Neoasaia chiangmaiensis NBRC 101099]|uniref:Uncharacterized protein n=1 Tax=Neoasaia chiangmaiensis TaxID=320497 RepID=A0A1U9KQ59_9PROT|nr:hypothetical protein [Neoasaia chiangmaiensis]AQS87938.1 hypothetical protein A0U93_08285 [Neoasaia chiangmaiensis]GBR39014.1 hypothetical protein AA101099_1489 [Neoasaia chiangmaiensis NBRC 101099]GEN15593.1 hypothetical protein NCH01_20240 [Neoasaia chiangmaiensis]
MADMAHGLDLSGVQRVLVDELVGAFDADLGAAAIEFPAQFEAVFRLLLLLDDQRDDGVLVS